ncbi:MAG: cbb3-type cytochrome c oxidase subunit I [Opitutales bacterium]|nr:cbb3-type cytochrome c oxidase subunit I [Opitutales bacterium]
MKVPSTFDPKTNSIGALFFLLSGIAFIASAIIGLVTSLSLGLPSEMIDWINHLPFQRLRPLHTMLAIVAMLAGAHGITESISVSLGNKSQKLKSVAFISIAAFTLLASITLANGKTSGREYISWVSWLSPLLIVGTVATLYRLLSAVKSWSSFSPEGFWLIVLGWGLTAFGLIETQGYLLPWIFKNSIRDLTQQWHGIDTIIAGVNILIYGGMVMILQGKAKPLRKSWLFAIATFGLLGTFGHHHYISPQPGYLKAFAFLASMVAILSFLRHINGYRHYIRANQVKPHPIMPLLLSAELWTIVAVCSGVLFAIPHLNFYVHGTYLIIAHAMGSMIGINLMIVVASALIFMRYDASASVFSIRWGTRIVNVSLVLLWVGLTIPSLIKGTSRTHEPYSSYIQNVEPWLISFPIIGVLLLAGIFVLISEMLWLPFCRGVLITKKTPSSPNANPGTESSK